MKREADILVMIERLTIEDLRVWVSEDWVRPAQSEGVAHFSDADIARIRLINTLLHEFEVGWEAVPIILSLIDQIHDLRGAMRRVSAAIEMSPENMRATLRALIDDIG